MKTSTKSGFTLVELLVVIAVIGILVALLFPAVQSVRAAARKTECANNMRQIGFALHNFESSYRVFPASGWTKAGPGNPQGKQVGWRPLILPFIEQNNLYGIYDFSMNWWEGSNSTVAAVPVTSFTCPSVPDRSSVLSAIAKPPRPAVTFENPIAPTDYEAIMGVKPDSINPHLTNPIYSQSNRFGVMHRNSRNGFAAIRDGSTHTIMIVECSGRPDVYRNGRIALQFANDQGIGWADSEGPFSLDGSNADGSLEGAGVAGLCNIAMNKRNDNEPYSFHAAGGNFLFADGHVNFISSSISLESFAAMCTRSGGEIVFEDQ